MGLFGGGKDRDPKPASDKQSKITGKGPGRKHDQDRPYTKKYSSGHGKGEPPDPKGKGRKPR